MYKRLSIHWFNWPNQQWNPRVFAWLYHVTNQLHNQFCEFYCLGNFWLVISYYTPSQTKFRGRIETPCPSVNLFWRQLCAPPFFFTTEWNSLKICTLNTIWKCAPAVQTGLNDFMTVFICFNRLWNIMALLFNNLDLNLIYWRTTASALWRRIVQ